MSGGRRRLAAVAALLGALVLSSGVLAPTAAAKDDYNDKVGYLDAAYWPADDSGYEDRFYSGLAFPAYRGAQCVAVQRKSSVVGWTAEHVRILDDADRCRDTFQWEITNDLAVQRTVAIRLYVTSGAYAGSYFNICNTKSQCLAMRP